MKLVYIISQGHSGSTLTDCILGTHPDFVSSGELCYLNWQLYRTKGIKGSAELQNICTCGSDFRDCSFWSEVIAKLKNLTGKDISSDPESFETAFFGMFSFQENAGFKRKFLDKAKSFLFREWLERGYKLKYISWLEPKVNIWLKNNWLLYDVMAEVANKKFVVDSSKDLRIALLLKEFKPEDVFILFVHRDIKGLASSSKKLSEKYNKVFSLDKIVKEKVKFENTVKRLKEIDGLQFIDAHYEEIVKDPAVFLDQVINKVDANVNYNRQKGDFYINPREQHLVAGNPIRYKGNQKVVYDDTWMNKLDDEQINIIKKLLKKYSN